MRVFLDTNVLVSAFATRGLCADLLRLVLSDHVLLVGEVNLVELKRVLRKRMGVSAETVAEIERFLREQEIVPHPKNVLPIPVRDRDDAWVLASAAAGGADVLVTGDRDLLDTAPDAPIRILSPRGFWDFIRKARRSRK